MKGWGVLVRRDIRRGAAATHTEMSGRQVTTAYDITSRSRMHVSDRQNVRWIGSYGAEKLLVSDCVMQERIETHRMALRDFADGEFGQRCDRRVVAVGGVKGATTLSKHRSRARISTTYLYLPRRLLRKMSMVSRLFLILALRSKPTNCCAFPTASFSKSSRRSAAKTCWCRRTEGSGGGQEASEQQDLTTELDSTKNGAPCGRIRRKRW